MGGRCSNFHFGDNGEVSTNKVEFTPLIDAEHDTISERNNDYIDILQDENINVCISTDNFKAENFNPNIKKIYEITDKFNGIAKNIKHSQLDVRGAEFEGNTVACFSYYVDRKDDMTIFLNSNLSKVSKQMLELETKSQVDAKYWSPCDKEEYINHTLAHEYGHFVEKLLIDKKMQADERSKNMSYVEKKQLHNILAVKIKFDILKIQQERFNKKDKFISDYGEKDSREFFAETFANLVNSKNPTTLAKSLEIYIKENL